MRPSPPSRFRVEVLPDPDGVLRLRPVGELDVLTAPVLSRLLRGLGRPGTHLRLDLAEVAFLDSTGLAAVLTCAREAAAGGWCLELARPVSDAVGALLELVAIDDDVWPTAPTG